MTSLILSEDYRGASVTLRASDGYANAAEMQKAAGFGEKHAKSPHYFLKLEATRRFMHALSEDLSNVRNLNLPTSKLVEVRHGGIAPGTWMHPDLALEFARWLSPEFAIWTNRVIRKVLSGQPLDDAQPQEVSAKLSQIIDCLAALAESHVRLERRVSDIEEYLTRPRPKLAAGSQNGRPDSHPATLILAVLAEGPFSIWQLSHRLGWKRRTIERKLHQLRGEGKIVWSGKGFALAPAKEAAP